MPQRKEAGPARHDTSRPRIILANDVTAGFYVLLRRFARRNTLSALSVMSNHAVDEDGEIDYTEPPREPLEPTDAIPGTPEKIKVMRQRVSRGEMPHHPLDAKLKGSAHAE